MTPPPDRFVLEDGALGPEARFVRDASGQVVGVRVWGQFNRRHPPVP
jgi:hypothetical protein